MPFDDREELARRARFAEIEMRQREILGEQQRINAVVARREALLRRAVAACVFSAVFSAVASVLALLTVLW